MPRDWDASSYDSLPLPHTQWGAGVLDRLGSHSLADDARLLDAGCGTGRDAAAALARWPDLRLVLLDGSPHMLEHARLRLGGAAEYVEADLALPLPVAPVDAVMSVAAFHWVPDHALLFGHLAAVMRRGAPLVSDCGGAGNLAGFGQALERVTGAEAQPWHFADVDDTVSRLEAAGFEVRDVRLRPDPFLCSDEDLLETFLATVVLGSHLDQLPEDEHAAFVAEVRRALPMPGVDYVRLEIDAVRR